MPPQSPFIGREAHIEFFQDNLILKKDHCHIISVSGQYGVGKTEFLLYCKRYADEQKFITLWIDCKEQIPLLSIMEGINDDIKKKKQKMHKFDEKYIKYIKMFNKRLNGNDGSSNSEFANGIRTLVKYGFNLARILGTGSPNEALRLIGMMLPTDQMGDWVGNLITRIFIIRDEMDLSLNASEKLRDTFFEDLRVISIKHPMLLFFDAHESCNKDLDKWLSLCIEALFRDTAGKSSHIDLVIAGRDDLSSKWIAYHHLRKSIKLEPFKQEEVEKFIRRLFISEDIKRRIYNLPSYLPAIIAIMAQLPDNDDSDPVTNYVLSNTVEGEEKEELILSASLPRIFNKDILGSLLAEQTPEEVSDFFHWLQKQSFVEKYSYDNSRQGWFYNGTTRFYLSNYLYQQNSSDKCNELHQRLITYYKNYQKKLKIDPKQQQSSKYWLDAELEIIYHSLCLIPVQDVYTVSSSFLNSFQLHINYGLRWAKTIQDAGRDHNNIEIFKIGKMLFTGIEKAYYPRYDLSVTRREDMLRRGYAYYLTKKFNLAVRDFCGALKRVDNSISRQEREAMLDPLQLIDKGCGEFLLGLLSAQGGKNFHAALSYFDHALAQEPQNVWAVIGRHFIFRHTGNSLDSDKEYKRACSIDPSVHHDSQTMSLLNNFMSQKISIDAYIHFSPQLSKIEN